MDSYKKYDLLDNHFLISFKEFTCTTELLHPNLKLSKMEVMFIVMNMFLRHNLSNVAVCDILQLINLIVGYRSLPETYSEFSHFFSKSSYTRHYVCEECEFYIGEKIDICKNCKSPTNFFFITFDFISNLRDILARNWHSIVEHQTKCKLSKHITDVLNAGVAKARNLKNGVTLTLNTDGVKIFNSNVKKSLWPLIICINDLPANLRFLRKNILISGLWLHNGEPNLEIFLKPLSEMLKQVYSYGLSFDSVLVEVHMIACCVDTKARCKIQNLKQFNGYEACSFCLHPGDVVKKQIRYGYKNNIPKRNLIDTLRAMAVSSSRGVPVNGVKGISPLIRIPQFDVIRNCPMDYMHGILLGVCRQLSRIWFETPSSPSYIKDKIGCIDNMLTSMNPFIESSRNARKITDRHSWKANEWLQWLLHYSPVCLGIFLQNEYYDHYYLLVSSITLLLQDEISEDAFESSERMLLQFVERFEQLYGIEEMTYNVHLVSHIVDCSRDYGPLWTFSLFVFEDVNGVLKKYVKGPKEPIIQIANRCVMSHTRNNAEVSFMQSSVKSFWDKLSRTQSSPTENKSESFYLDNRYVNKYSDNRIFEKQSSFAYNGYIFKPKTKNEMISKHKRKPNNDCYFSLFENSKVLYGEINCILADTLGTYFLFNAIQTEQINGHHCKALILQEQYLVKVNIFLVKHIKMQIGETMYLSKMQYKLHID